MTPVVRATSCVGPVLIAEELLEPNRDPERCPREACAASCSTSCRCAPCGCPRCVEVATLTDVARGEVLEHRAAARARRYRYGSRDLRAPLEVEGPGRLPLHLPRAGADDVVAPPLF